MKPFAKDGLRAGMFFVLLLLVVSSLGMARTTFTLSDAIWFASSGTVENREEFGALFSTGGFMFHSQATFNMDNFLGAELGAKYAQGLALFRARSSFNKEGFTKATGTLAIKASNFSLAGSANVGLTGIEKGILNATLNVGPFDMQGVVLFQRTTLTASFATVSYAKAFDCGNLTSTAQFSGRRFSEEKLVLTTSRDGFELGNTWVFTTNGWAGGVITASRNLSLVHLTSSLSWGLRGVEEAALGFRALVNDFQTSSTLKFNSEGCTRWSSLVRIKQGNVKWQGSLLAAQNRVQGRIKATASFDHVALGGTFEFTHSGLQRVILEATKEIRTIKVHAGLTFTADGVSAEFTVEGQWNVGG